MGAIKLNAKLRVLEITFEHLNEVRLQSSARKLREEIELMLNWFESVTGSSGVVHPKRLSELKHYAVIYHANILKYSRKLFVLLSEREEFSRISNLIYVHECLRNMSWLDSMVEPYIEPTDLRSHEDFTTLYSLCVTSEIIAVGSLDQIENKALSSRDPIYEVTCRSSNYRIEDGLFLISIRDVAESRRYR